jgi:hypothetical protein
MVWSGGLFIAPVAGSFGEGGTMTSRQRHLVLAAFDELDRARAAIDDLGAAGFEAGDVGLAVLSGEASEDYGRPPSGPDDPAEPATGFVGGITWAGAPGGVIPGLGVVVASGLMSSLLTGAAAGDTRSLLDELHDKGVPDAEARRLDEAFRAGKSIVGVRADGRSVEAEDIVTRHGGRRSGR